MTEANETIIANEIRRHFKFLFDRGFSIRSVRFIREYMGYWRVMLESASCWIEVANDRSEIYVSVQPRGKSKEQKWFGLRTLVLYLSQGKHYVGIYAGELRDRDKQFERLAIILAEYIDGIVSIMGRDFEEHEANLEIAYRQVLDLDTRGSNRKSS